MGIGLSLFKVWELHFQSQCEASDVYSLCATMYNLMAGEEPWADVINSKIRDITVDLDLDDLGQGNK